MKKLCLLLGSISLVLTTSSTVVSCKSGLGLSTKYTDEEKITSIKTINESLLLDNGVSIGDALTKEDIQKLLEMLDIDPENTILANSLKVYVMANQLLNEISTKVPGYDWIANKLTWQSQWALVNLLGKDIPVKDEEAGITYTFSPFPNNVSGWMSNQDSWSLSVTFLNNDELKTPWNGTEPPGYARININKFIRADKEGTIKYGLENTVEDPTDPDIKNSLKPIPTKDIGPIYQGYWSGSKLLSLDGIYNPNKGKLPPGFINYSPSAADFINNQIFDLDFGNIILSKAKEEIETQVTNYLLNNPIWLNEGSEFSDIHVRIKNQIYIAMYMKGLEIDDIFSSKLEDLIIAKTFMTSWTRMLRTNLTLTANMSHNSSIKSEIITFINDYLSEKGKISRWLEDQYSLSETDKINIKKALEAYIPLSRDPNNVKAKEIDFGSNNLTVNLFKTSSINLNAKQEQLLRINDFIDFGFDNSYKFEALYYSKSFNKDYESDLWYKPDENPKDLVNVADAGFNNVFFYNRFNPDYDNSSLAKYYADGNKGLDVSPFDTNNLAKQEYKDFKDEYAAGQADALRISHLADLINQNSELRLNDFVIKDIINNPNLQVDLINNLKASKGPSDDKAFAKLINDKDIILKVTDGKGLNQTSDLRSSIYRNGIENDVVFSDFRIMANKINSWGDPIDKENEDQWYKQSKYNIYKLTVKLDYGSSEFYSTLKESWDRDVKNNPNNPDYNPSIW